MRIVSLGELGSTRLGVIREDGVLDLAIAAPDAPRDLRSVLEGAAGGIPGVASMVEAASTSSCVERKPSRFAPPIARPGKIICLGLNYADHAAEGGHSTPHYPSLFLRSPSSLVGHGAAIVRPACSQQLDYEGELVAVIGRKARHVKEHSALDYVAGYSCFNDASIRDYQRKTAQWTIGKNFDCTGAFGPAFVTADELPAGGRDLRITTRLNGRTLQTANTSDMLFSVAKTVEILTECMTLDPGDIIVMGTPSGVGHARKPPVWMKAGDVVEVEIERIGLLRNPIVDEPLPSPLS